MQVMHLDRYQIAQWLVYGSILDTFYHDWYVLKSGSVYFMVMRFHTNAAAKNQPA